MTLQKVCAFLNSTSLQSLRIESMSLDFSRPVSPGNAVRALAVDHGLFPEEYPRGNERSLATVLNHLELTLMVAPERWHALEPILTRLAADFPAREREITQQWMADMWPLVTPSTFDATSMMDVDSDFSIGGQPIDGLRPPQPMEDLRRARTQMLALLDDLDKSAKKQALGQWVREVCGSGLPAHEQALLIGEFALQVRDLEPSEVAESAWRLCLDGLAGIAQSLPRDPALNGLLQQIAGAFPVLRTVRYPNNPMIAIAECCHRMGQAGYPGVVSALYLTAASQMAASLEQGAKDCSLAFGNLLRYIKQGIEAGDEVPMQVIEVLDPAVAGWTERHGGSVQEAWREFLRLIPGAAR
jgi:hypothetical protein